MPVSLRNGKNPVWENADASSPCAGAMCIQGAEGHPTFSLEFRDKEAASRWAESLAKAGGYDGQPAVDSLSSQDRGITIVHVEGKHVTDLDKVIRAVSDQIPSHADAERFASGARNTALRQVG